MNDLELIFLQMFHLFTTNNLESTRNKKKVNKKSAKLPEYPFPDICIFWVLDTSSKVQAKVLKFQNICGFNFHHHCKYSKSQALSYHNSFGDRFSKYFETNTHIAIACNSGHEKLSLAIQIIFLFLFLCFSFFLLEKVCFIRYDHSSHIKSHLKLMHLYDRSSSSS